MDNLCYDIREIIYKKFNTYTLYLILTHLTDNIDDMELITIILLNKNKNELCNEAAKNNDLECLKYAHKNGHIWNQDTCSYAAKYGSIECLEYLYENGCPWNIYVAYHAASAGNIECLKYAIENGCNINKRINYRFPPIEECEPGHLGECDYYEKDEGLPWDQNVCDYAASAGNIECLKYAYKKGSYLCLQYTGENVLALPDNKRIIEIYEYFKEIDPEYFTKGSSDFATIFYHKKNKEEIIEILDYIYENGGSLSKNNLEHLDNHLVKDITKKYPLRE